MMRSNRFGSATAVDASTGAVLVESATVVLELVLVTIELVTDVLELVELVLGTSVLVGVAPGAPAPHATQRSTVAIVCGRFTSLTPPDELAAIFATAEPSPSLFDEFRPNYNVAPTTRVAAVANDSEGHRRLGRFQWGLVPHWSKDPSGSARLINARSETVFEKPSFRSSASSRRCIVPMDGFYEWRTVYDSPRPAKSPKEPVYVTRSDGRPLAVAGLWASWRDPAAGEDAPWLHTCCIVTTSANDTLAPVHDRMPVILEPADWSTWLDVSHSNRDELSALMMPAERGVVRVIDVAPIVNSIRNNGPELIVPITR